MRKLQIKGKIRGAKSQIRSYYKSIGNAIELAPSKYESRDYWHLKIPISEPILHKRPRLTRELLNTFITFGFDLFSKYPQKTRTDTVILSYPNLFSCELCSFYTEEYFKTFKNRSSEYQEWLPREQGIIEKFGLSLPKNTKVINFNETINDEGCQYTSIITIIEYC